MHVLESKSGAVSRRGNHFKDEVNNSESSAGATAFARTTIWRAVNARRTLPEKPFIGNFNAETQRLTGAIAGLPPGSGGELLTESYVNLIPDPCRDARQRPAPVRSRRDATVNTAIFSPRGVKLSAKIFGIAALMCLRENAGPAICRAD